MSPRARIYAVVLILIVLLQPGVIESPGKSCYDELWKVKTWISEEKF